MDEYSRTMEAMQERFPPPQYIVGTDDTELWVTRSDGRVVTLSFERLSWPHTMEELMLEFEDKLGMQESD